ncbi:12537_t:CDS:1 [Funneliformis caledonium]|uniref:12537_t:CDS:1 n=1 Tax=Funneliformis caledonium TaxID=1117310 RepID=A0A9N9AT32_9GLOM|nr:12537_t:CDS:1 [Funneliformis caledonium]
MSRIIILLGILLTLASFVRSTPLELRKRLDPLTGFKMCDGNFPIIIDTFTYNPNPVIPGHNLAIRIAGVANEVVENGAILRFYHDQGENVAREADFCEEFVEQSKFICPIKGYFDLTSIIFLESSPTEPKNVSVNLYTKMIRK